MFGQRIELLKLYGFPIRIDLSWVFLALLVTWSLAVGFFPLHFPFLSPMTYWIMGLIGALGLFISIILHELSHSLVARRYGLPIGGITLFIFGGVAEMEEEPSSSRVEFLMGIAGPVASIIIATFFSALTIIGRQVHFPDEVIGITYYLSFINFLLAIFNMLPAFPLDGGRVLRSILWAFKHNLRWATRISSRIGSWFGVALIVLGILNFIVGSFLGGIWFILIGLFLRGAANMSYQQLLIKKQLEDIPLSRFMQPNPVTVPAEISLEELVENYFYKYYFKMYPVIQEGLLRGYVSLEEMKKYPREQWGRYRVGDVMVPCSSENTVSPDTDMNKILSLMSHLGTSRVMVADQGKLIGMLSLKDLLRVLSLKLELEERQP